MPSRRAVSTTFFVPTRRSTRTVATLIECSRAYWYVTMPLYLLLVVLRLPGRLPRVDDDRDRRVEHRVGGREALLDGRQVDDRLERRADLPERLDGPVELRAVEVVAADERADGARCRSRG